MLKRRNKFDWILIIVFGIVLILNLAGFVIEGLFRFGILQTDVANVRKLGVISGILSLGFIFSGIFFIMNFFKSRKKSILYWHIFMGITLIMGIYKFIKPTYLSELIPYYKYIFLAVVLVVWGLIFYYLRKKSIKQPDSGSVHDDSK